MTRKPSCLISCSHWLPDETIGHGADPKSKGQTRAAQIRKTGPQNFALNLSAKRRLCNTVGGRFVAGCVAYLCAVSAARSRAATTTNLARSSLALVLRAIFGGAKSCALVNLFIICPPMVGWWLADGDQIRP